MCKNVIIIGAGGYAKVIADIILKSGDNLIGFLDDNIPIGTQIIKANVLGKINDVCKFSDYKFVIGIGNNQIRKQIACRYSMLDYYTAINPFAIIGNDVKIGIGSVIMAGAVINTSARIGLHCIINTCAVIEHDNCIENYVHISPNSALGGTVNIKDLTHIGIGAVVKNNLNITSNCVVGAGAVVVKDITEQGVYIGVPARRV